ncbi:hypothetical protein BD626DRAFT_595911 [Schizophyllum amplum]|uniref:Asl1-like glycosyl hydrolase catalytic domain-containing protein n=1 Tax=Schizophyllum amplum TaxID=97359 RepID=A0A550CCC5_9AGAR|nr:hypothetical protein BD626DRAFT_595911 [Auriculariopsis ampla]
MPSFPTIISLLAAVAPALATNAKRGLAYSDKTPLDDIAVAKGDGGAASWVYTWQTLPADQIKNSGLEFVPMQHDRTGVADLASNLAGLGAKVVLGFNEPERADQSNIPVAEAVQFYKDTFAPLKDSGIRIGAPAVSAAPEGQQWIKDFMDQCGDACGVDFVPLHWYGDGAQYFLDYVTEFHGWFSLPIWVTGAHLRPVSNL